MANLTLKNIPAALLARLRRRAVVNRRSLNREVIASLEATMTPTPLDPDTLLARARAVRLTPRGLRLTDRTLARLRSAGRP
jgi:plasmid stability protein